MEEVPVFDLVGVGTSAFGQDPRWLSLEMMPCLANKLMSEQDSSVLTGISLVSDQSKKWDAMLDQVAASRHLRQ